jgi:hypothetical protein
MDRPGLLEALFALVFSKAERRGEQERDQQQTSEHENDNSMARVGTGALTPPG